MRHIFSNEHIRLLYRVLGTQEPQDLTHNRLLPLAVPLRTSLHYVRPQSKRIPGRWLQLDLSSIGPETVRPHIHSLVQRQHRKLSWHSGAPYHAAVQYVT